MMDGQHRETQLFNLANNPRELIAERHNPNVVTLTGFQPRSTQTNLADNPKYANKLEEMEKLLLSEMRLRDDPFRLWNQPRD